MAEQQGITKITHYVTLEGCPAGDDMSVHLTSNEIREGLAYRHCEQETALAQIKVTVSNGICKATCITKDCPLRKS